MSDGRERAIIKRILTGDRAAGARFVDEEYPRVYRFLRHLTRSVDDAEDLAQQTFLKAWRALEEFRGESSLATWLHRIAYHEYTHWLRSRREHLSLDEDRVPNRPSSDADEGLWLEAALARLSHGHRETFLLVHVQGFTVEEVASVMEVPPGTVKSRLFSARRRLREILTEPVEATHEIR